MKAWYSKVRDTELKDGSVRATYVVVFETDNIELKREVEKYLQGIMDKTEPQTETPYDNCQKCVHWVYDGYWYCECNEYHYEPKTEPSTDCGWK